MNRAFVKSRSKSRLSEPLTPAEAGILEFREQCDLCEEYLPEDRLVLRCEQTNNIICIFCTVAIAKMISKDKSENSIECPNCKGNDITVVYRPEVYEYSYLCKVCGKGFN